MISSLFLPFTFDKVNLTSLTIFSIFFTLFCAAWLIVIAYRAPHNVARPAFLVAGFSHLLFQWPIALFSDLLSAELRDFYLMSGAIHCAVVGSCYWVWRTPGLTVRLAHGNGSNTADDGIGTPVLLTLVGIFVLLATVYIVSIEPQCTALYALIFDAASGLLARETAGKIFGAGAPSYIYGILYNAVCPLLLLCCVVEIRRALAGWKIFKAIALLGVAAVAIFATLLTGTKGNIVPTAVGVTVGILASGASTLIGRAILVAICGLVALLVISGFDTFVNRQADSNGCYPVGACAVRSRTCEPTKALIASLWARDRSLGLERERLTMIEADLLEHCADVSKPAPELICRPSSHPLTVKQMRELILAQKASPPTPVPSVSPPKAEKAEEVKPKDVEAKSSIASEQLAPAAPQPPSPALAPDAATPPPPPAAPPVAVPQAPAAPPPAATAPAATAPAPTAEDVEKAEKRLQDIKERIEVATGKPVEAPSVVSSATGIRILDFIVAVAYRAGVVPMQVASWHYRYAEEHGRPGLRAFPVISSAAGGRIVMGIAVHDAYYPIVSGGDRTATGTTPVSFILGYPAWLGPMGIVLVLACIILYDCAVVLALALLRPALRWAGVGLFSIASYNMMMSEFTTVMFSHGAIAALIILAILGLVGRWTFPTASEKMNG